MPVTDDLRFAASDVFPVAIASQWRYSPCSRSFKMRLTYLGRTSLVWTLSQFCRRHKTADKTRSCESTFSYTHISQNFSFFPWTLRITLWTISLVINELGTWVIHLWKLPFLKALFNRNIISKNYTSMFDIPSVFPQTMDEAGRKALQRNQELLTKDLVISDELFAALVRSRIFTESMVDEIKVCWRR